jgi:hypothetical protein
MKGNMIGLLDQQHASGCDGQEYSSVEVAPFGHGFAVVHTEWCGDCGAADYDILDFVEPEGER